MQIIDGTQIYEDRKNENNTKNLSKKLAFLQIKTGFFHEISIQNELII
jgi:hypothetical protein